MIGLIGHWLLQLCGVVGNIAFGIGCGPEAYDSIRLGFTRMPRRFAWILFTACWTFYVYLIGTYGWSWYTGPLGFIETGSYIVVLWYNYFPRPLTKRE
jgi:hypothetical protein